MAGDSPREAVRNFVGPLQRSVSCVTRAQLSYPSPTRAEVGFPYDLLLGDGTPQKMRGPGRLLFEMSHSYEVVEADGVRGPYKVSTRGYWYVIRDPEDRELFGFHWHPIRYRTPHIHVHPPGEAIKVEGKTLHRFHIPTGLLSLEEVLLFGINDLGIEPIRYDWADVLANNQRRHEEWRTWPGFRVGPRY